MGIGDAAEPSQGLGRLPATEMTLPPMSAVPGEMETEVHTSICTQMFTAAPFTTAQQWEQPKCPPTERLIHKTWPLHPMDYDSAVKSDALAPATNTDELGKLHTE